MLLDSSNHSYWSTASTTTPIAGLTYLQISDSGNLALHSRGSTRARVVRTLWQSFDNPTDTFLPGMDISEGDFNLTSWKSPQHPATGHYSFQNENWGLGDELIVYNYFSASLYWSSISTPLHHYLTPLLWRNSTPKLPPLLRVVMNSYGRFSLIRRVGRCCGLLHKISVICMIAIAEQTECVILETALGADVCQAISPGFHQSQHFPEGCLKKTSDQCGGDMFLPLPMIRLPPQTYHNFSSSNGDDCESKCQSDCTCKAYSLNESTCLIWTDDLSHVVEEYYHVHNHTLHIRLNHLDIDDHHKHIPLFLKVGIPAATALFLLIGVFSVIHLRRRQVAYRKGIADQFKVNELEEFDIPFVDYQSILAATNNFSDSNKLGAGGFGPVYRGSLADGNEVAVKRLSAASLQGVQELRNEIIVIGKLQHRNLVRVVGYCIKEEEKILIYEYMPNKSLDSLLFDQVVSPLLDWTKRFNIILGIARGLLYLHQDSRLRIIHRDLKPSNILLDDELNPKISDFGLAKIVAGNEMAENTARVVGTYGYMSPEYALDGQFSVKSDVYSFGIIVFEVITGKRCSTLLQLGDNLVSVLGYAWAMWEKGEQLEMTDKTIIDTCDSNEVKRCINVAFLCIQEDPRDRPTMSSALLMLGGDKVNLPCPKQPVFVARRQSLGTSSSSTHSNVKLTTTFEGS